MITDTQFAAWLDDSTAQRVTLYDLSVRSGGAEIVRYVSNQPYALGPTSTPYLAVVASDLEITESISMDGEAKLSTGELGIHSVGGTLDAWLLDIWSNRSATVRVGDVRWPIADFRTVFVGMLADIAPGSNRNLLTIKFRDIMQALNTPVSEAKLSGDVLRPVSLGEVPNMTPKYDAATTRWYYGTGQNEGMIEARTDGKPRLITDDPATGSFTFNGAVGPGAVTCSVQGDKTGGTYRSTIASLVQLLVTSYGKASTRLTAADIDTANFAAFESANPQPVGLGLADRTPLLVACAQLASSKGAQLIPSRLGKLRLIQYAIPTVSTKDIRLADQVKVNGQNSLIAVTRTSAQAAVSVGGCRNYTPQPNLQTSLPDAHKALFAAGWRSATSIATATQTDYKLTTDAVQRDTCLIDDADIQVEADRILNIVKVPRTTYQYKGTPNSLLLELGQAVRLYGDRYNLSAGVIGLVTRISINFGTCRATVEVTA